MNFSRFLSVWSLVALTFFLLSGCGDPDPVDSNQTNQDECPAVCIVGDTQCDGNGVQLCANVDGCPGWTEVTTCSGGNVCREGRCIDPCDDDCEIGSSRCSDDGVQYCVSAAGCPAWSETVTCPGTAVCTEDRCHSDCTNECSVGERQCAEDGFRRCEYNAQGCLQWSEPESCPSGESCTEGFCASDCTDQCEDGDRRCSTSAGFEICQQTAQGCLDWSAPIQCGDDLLCSGGQCVTECADICTAGATQCSGTGSFLVCETQASGCTDWSPGSNCQANESCTDGQCVESCQDECSAGAARCGAGGEVETCQYRPSGCLEWTQAISCPDTMTCNGGDCVFDCTDACTPGAAECSGNGVRFCQQQTNGCFDWTLPVSCGTGLSCENGQCVASCSDQCSPASSTICDASGGVLLCQEQQSGCLDWSGPFNCPAGHECDSGDCVALPAESCSALNPTGQCPAGQVCQGGSCISAICSAENPGGNCPAGQYCDNGQCVGQALCDCAATEVCLDGVCYPEEETCSAENPTGLCESGYDCIVGSCLSADQECSATNVGGVCPVGQWCDDGSCTPIDGDPLCSDANPCTDSWFNYHSNRCESLPADNPCSDGNGCTANWCEDGQCMSQPVAGCIEPPTLDPWSSPTNDGTLFLSGTKPAGSAIRINGTTAVNENPDTTWSVGPLNLTPGENTFIVRSVEGTTESEAQEVIIVYDNVRPVTSVTPSGGTFLNGITVQVTTSEPATVYYTTDGSTPDASSLSFESIRQFRVFEPTRLRFLARDRAGNWEQSVVEAGFDITSYANRWSTGPALASPVLNAGVTTLGNAIYVVGGDSGSSVQAGVRQYDFVDEAWSTLPSLPGGRSELALVAHGNRLYAIGGQDEGTALNTLSSLRPGIDSSWSNLPAMPTTRFGLAAVVFNNKIYAFGGKSSGGTVRNTLEVYTPGGSWTNQVAQMPRPRYGASAIEYGGEIYLLGGLDQSDNPIAVVDVYNPTNDTWSEVAPMPTPRAFTGAGLMMNFSQYVGTSEVKIVVAGGVDASGNATSVVEEFNITTGAWRTRKPLAAARAHTGAATISLPDDTHTLQRQIWLVGGEVAASPSTDISIYTHDLGHKRLLAPLPQARFEHAAAVLNDRIYLFAGRHEGNQTSGWAFNPETETYAVLPDLPGTQNGLVAAALNGRVYAIGGANQFGNPLSTVQAFDPVSWQWESVVSDLSPRRDAAVAVLGEEVYIIGGENNGAVQTVEIFNPREGTWRSGPTLPAGRRGAMAVVHDSDIYVFGGVNSSGGAITSTLRLAHGASSWQTVSGAAVNAAFGSAFRVGEDALVIVGGRQAGNLTDRIWFYDVSSGQSSTMSSAEPLDRSAAVYHHGRIYVFGGNEHATPGSAGVDGVQKFDLQGCAPNTSSPISDTWCVPTSFLLADFATPSGSSNHVTRGYRFRVARPVYVTALYGGATATGFHLGLYRASGNTGQQALVTVDAPATRRGRVEVDPILLQPGVDYIIAQGRASGSGFHFELGPISSAVTSHPVIDIWNPTAPSDSLIWSGGNVVGTTGTANTIRPDLGFDFR